MCSFKLILKKNVFSQRRLKLWWPGSECASVFVSKKGDSSKTENRSWKEHHGECLRRFFKKKNVVGEKASRSAHDLLHPPILKLYPFKNFTLYYGSLWRGKLFSLQCHARTICTDSHCWYTRGLGHFFKKKASYPTQCCPAKAWMTQIRTRIRVCQCIM